MKISLCTTCMNRVDFLKEALPCNLRDNQNDPDVEFVVLNYNSQDDMDEWMKQYTDLMESGRLVYVHELSASHFRPAHSRNVCALFATGDVICNVDADNFTGHGYSSYLREYFQKHEEFAFAYSPDVWQKRNESSHGRVALFRRDFLRFGGYDERQIGFGEEDTDLIRRCKAMGFSELPMDRKYLKFIPHDNWLRIKNIDLSTIESQNLHYFEKIAHLVSHEEMWFDDLDRNQVHAAITHGGKAASVIQSILKKEWGRRQNEQRSIDGVEKKSFVVNFGKKWGHARVVKNYQEEMDTEYTWPKMKSSS